MVKFLISRPIGVIMTFVALVMLGIVAYRLLPVSLMPNVDIPEITVQVHYPNSSARELENGVVKGLRSNLMQVAHLKDIRSETKDGRSNIKISFEYGTSIEYAFIEVNEKVDAAMNTFPRDMKRPRVVKASATDLPVFYLNVSLKTKSVSTDKFIELSEFCEDVVAKRMEQLPEVAMVDISGLMNPQILVIPDKNRMESLNISSEQLKNAMEASNANAGDLNVVDGHYQYQIRFSSKLRTVNDIKNVYLRVQNRILQIKDLAQVTVQNQKLQGLFLTGDKQAVTMAVIQQADVKIADLKKTLNQLLRQFETDYPDLRFEMVKDQSQLLDISMSNLQQDLLMGGMMAFIILFLFLGDFRAPVLIGITIPLSLLISLLFFKVFNLSLNIISLAGLTLGLGMIIDCSIIVIENILHFYHSGHSLEDSCDKGTTEVIRPMISSTLSTSAVFLPLIFLSGLAGALFYDEAVSVSLGNAASLLVAITILPVLFKLFYQKKSSIRLERKSPTFVGFPAFKVKLALFVQKINVTNAVEKWYERGVDWVFGHQKLTTILFLLIITLNSIFFMVIKKERFPALPQRETIVNIEWNENIHLLESRRRMEELVHEFKPYIVTSNSQIGQQQFALNQEKELDYFEAEWYLLLRNTDLVKPVEDSIRSILAKRYPMAKVSFRPPTTIFERLFSSDEPPLLAQISLREDDNIHADSVQAFASLVDSRVQSVQPNHLALKQQLVVSIDMEKLMLYQVDYSTVEQSIKTALGQNQFSSLQSNQRFLPIVLGEESESCIQTLGNRIVQNNQGKEFPLKTFILLHRENEMKSIVAGKQGEFLGLKYDVTPNQAEKYQDEIRKLVQEKDFPAVQFEGALKSSNQLLSELGVILLISILLLYFILAAQFESLLQPFIVLLEIPANIAGALFLLYICGNSLNIMAGIGIIVGCGIFINDSIIKVDTINQLRKKGMPLIPAIRQGGLLRIGGILMTAATTILAVVPFLLGDDLGSVLQKPLSLALIGGMLVGTFVSLFFVPLVYWRIYRNEKIGKAVQPPQESK